jgi:HB1, ASXL, restriction endonuclease HTH domain
MLIKACCWSYRTVAPSLGNDNGVARVSTVSHRYIRSAPSRLSRKLFAMLVKISQSRKMPTWKQCIEKVLTDENGPLPYQEIYKRIMDQGLKRGGQAVTVNVTITNDIRDNGPISIFIRSGVGVYELRGGGGNGEVGEAGDGANRLRDLIINGHVQTLNNQLGGLNGGGGGMNFIGQFCNFSLPPSHGTPHEPNRISHGSFGANRGVWQYHINKKTVRVDVFFSPGYLADYDELVRHCHPEVTGVAHDFGSGVLGNGPELGNSRSIHISTDKGHSYENLHIAASDAIKAMTVLWKKFCAFL